MQTRQILFGLLLTGFLCYMSYKYFQSIPYTGDAFMSIFFALIVVGFLLFVLTRILRN